MEDLKQERHPMVVHATVILQLREDVSLFHCVTVGITGGLAGLRKIDYFLSPTMLRDKAPQVGTK